MFSRRALTLDPTANRKTGVNRALPDGEIRVGTPIPAIVPLPTLAHGADAGQGGIDRPFTVEARRGSGRRVKVRPEQDATGKDLVVDGKPVYKNPGYPFFIPGVAGHRPPHPPLDLAWLENRKTASRSLRKTATSKIYLDGGLPRHIVLDGKVLKEFHTRWDFSEDTALRDKRQARPWAPVH